MDGLSSFVFIIIEGKMMIQKGACFYFLCFLFLGFWFLLYYGMVCPLLKHC